MDASRTATLDETLLIFAIHGIRCGVPAQSVDTIVMPPPHLTHPPGSNRTRPGIFTHNGQVHGVVDLREAFGLHDENSNGGRLLLYHFGKQHFAFVVDEVVGLVRSEEGQWAPLPPDLPRKTFTRGFLHQRAIVLCSDFPRLLRLEDGEPLRRHFAAVVAARNAVATTHPPQEESQAPSTPEPPAATAAPQPHPSAITRVAAPQATPAPPAAPSVLRRVASPARATQPRALTPRPTSSGGRTATHSQRAPLPRTPLPPHRTTTTPATPSVEPIVEPRSPAQPTSQPPAHAPLTLLAVVLPLLLTLIGGWWFWPASEQAAPAPSPPVVPAPVAVTPQAIAAVSEPHQPLRIEKGEGGLTLIIEESTFTAPPTEATTPPPPPREARRIVHRVKKGDTLWGIAERYVHDPWRFRELAHQSGIDNPNLIYPGDEVTILIR